MEGENKVTHKGKKDFRYDDFDAVLSFTAIFFL